MRAFRWFLIGSALLSAGCGPSSPEPINLALLPLETQGGDRDAQLAAQGLAALLLAQLRAIPDARVSVDALGCDDSGGHTHALSLRNQETDASALIDLELTDCRSGRRMHETLIQPRNLRRDWSSEAAWWVAMQLNAPIALRSRSRTVDADIMSDYLGAVARLQKRTSADIGHARDTLRTVCARLPDFAPAQAQLATAHLLAYEHGLSSRAQAMAAARTAIAAALKEDPDLGLAHAAMGLVLMNEGRYLEAASRLAQAVALDPGDANGRLWLGNALLYAGRPREAIQWFEEALKLEPGLSSARTSRGEAACYSGDEPRCQAFLGQHSDAGMGAFVRLLLRAHRGDFAQVRAAIEASPAPVNALWTLELEAEVCAALGDESCAKAVIGRLLAQFPNDPDAARVRDRLQPDVGLAAEEPEAPMQLDLWQLGLGVDALVSKSSADPEARTRLAKLLSDAREGGLRLPALQIAEACLAGFSGDDQRVASVRTLLREQGYDNQELWRRWRCTDADGRHQLSPPSDPG